MTALKADSFLKSVSNVRSTRPENCTVLVAGGIVDGLAISWLHEREHKVIGT